MTAIAYVRAVRLADGTVWRANEAELVQKLRQVLPGIKDYGSEAGREACKRHQMMTTD